jgi:hypothetical protein
MGMDTGMGTGASCIMVCNKPTTTFNRTIRTAR